MNEVREPWGRWLFRRVRRWAFLLFLTYLGLIVVFLFLERSLVFHPTSTEEAWQNTKDLNIQNLTLASSDGNTISARWIPPVSPERGAVLVCNGNGGNLSHRERHVVNFHEALGTGVLLFDYPGYGKSTGSPNEGGCYAAGEAAFKWLTDEQKVPPNRIILCGESLGGGTAIELATKHDHRALVLIYTFTSLPATAKYHYPFLPTYTLMRTRFDNISKIGRCTRPVFITHGTDDRVIPFNHAEQLYAAANEPKHFLPIEDFDHGPLVGEPFTSELAKFLNQYAP